MIATQPIDLHMLSKIFFFRLFSLPLQTETVHPVQELPTLEYVRSRSSLSIAQTTESEKRIKDTHPIVFAV